MGVAGCTEDAADRPSDSPSESAKPEVAPAQTKAALGVVSGKYNLVKDGPRLLRKVQTVVDGWIDAAYVEGTYPRTDFANAFPGFTKGAAASARTDEALTSNAAIGSQIDSVNPRKRAIKVDVVARDGTAFGVTARINLVLKIDGEIDRRDTISGDLYLIYARGGWQVFGYELERGQA